MDGLGSRLASLLLALTFALPTAAGPGTSDATQRIDDSSSVWIQRERRRFEAVLGRQKVDVLVAPFQISGKGLDPAERLLMALRVADHLGATSSLSVADPILTGRSLGEGARKYPDADILALAERVGARTVLIGSTGHDGDNTLRVAIRVLQSTGTASRWSLTDEKEWNDLTLSDERPPYQEIERILPEVRALVPAPASRPPVGAVSFTEPKRLPALGALIADHDEEALNIHVAQLLASCYPRSPESGHERAWVQTLRLAHRGPDAHSRLPVARALTRLGRRPAAIAALGTPRTSAERSLRELLDGNLPAASAHAARITDPVLRLIAQIELRDTSLYYGTSNRDLEVRAFERLLSESSDWHPHIHVRIQGEGSGWRVEESLSSLARFSALFDVGTQPVEDVFQAMSEEESYSDWQVGAVGRALTSYDELIAKQPGPAYGAASLLRWLALDLYQTQILTNALTEIEATLDTRGSIDAAHELIGKLDPLLRGHPDFAAAKARIGWHEYARWRGEQRARWLQHALEHSRAAYEWSHRLTGALAFAERKAPNDAAASTSLDPVRMIYFRDWPVRLVWMPRAVREDARAMRRYAEDAFRYSILDFPLLDWLLAQPVLAGHRAKLRAALAGRFDGHPQVTQNEAFALLERDDVAGAERVLERFVATRPLAIGPYQSYADLLAGQGRHDEALRMYRAYPGFEEDSGENAVAMSNQAGWFGWSHWMAGRVDHARPLFELAASYRSGSSYALSSEALIALDDGRLNESAKLFMNNARRYSDLEALNRYFELIFALGRPEEAWRIYQEVHQDGNGGRVLATIARGARTAGWSDQQITDWLASSGNAGLSDGTFYYAPRAALAAAVMDRNSPRNLSGMLRKLNAPSPYRYDTGSRKVLAGKSVCGPSRYGGGPTSQTQLSERIDSHLTYFARAYEALQSDAPANAFAILDEAARLFEFYGHDCENVSYLLPYLALAAARAGDATTLRGYLEQIGYSNRGTDYHLAFAALEAGAGRHQQAEAHLEAAVDRWAWHRHKVLPSEYIYADILQRLHQSTGVPSYRDRLLRWARVRQRVTPAEGWTYAIEARHSTVAADRIRALTKLVYLDPNSSALHGARPEEVAAARASIAADNPFLAWRRTDKKKAAGNTPEQPAASAR